MNCADKSPHSRKVRQHGSCAFGRQAMKNQNTETNAAPNAARSEQKRTEEALRRSEARFRLLSDTAGRLLATNDPQGLVNELCCEVMEYLDCQFFFNFLIDDPTARLFLNAYSGISRETAAQIEWISFEGSVCGCVAREGQRIIAENIQVVPDPGTELVKSFGVQAYCGHPLKVEGKVIGTLSFGTKTRANFADDDIEVMRTVADQVATAMHRIRGEEALREANATLDQKVRERTAELEVTYRTAPVGLAMLDCDLRYMRINDRLAEINGLPSSAHIGRTIREVAPEFDDQYSAALRQIIKTGKPLTNIEFRNQAEGESGVERIWNQTWHPVRDANDRITGINVMVEDITERKHAEKRIADERKQFKDALDRLPAYVILLSPDYCVPFANRYFEERFGKSEGRRCFEYLFKRSEPCENCETFKVLKTNMPHRWEWTGPDDRLYDIHDFPFNDVDGSPLIMEVGLDVTEQKRAEKDLRWQSEQLRALASQLTLVEQRERLRLAQVLHDGLQQNLVAAILRLSLIEESSDKSIRRTATDISSILHESVEISRSLTAELSPPILREGGLIPSLEWLARWMQDRQGLNVNLITIGEIHPSAEDVTVLLFQAVRELLFNVVKHSGVKSAHVHVERKNGQLNISVMDEGIGFDPAKAREHPEKREGFGLASIRHRLDFLGGKMSIESAPGQGTRVALTMEINTPASVQTVPPPKVSVSIIPLHEEPQADGTKRIHVVLADDHPVMRQGLAGLLRGQPDIEIIGEASDGESVVRLVSQTRPEVVLMDISMPGMGGIEATRIIHSKFPNVHIIGLSMFEEAEIAAAIRKAGAINCLTKSGPSKEIIDAIRECRAKAGSENRT
jgi:PAS domain S-box-containing protein